MIIASFVEFRTVTAQVASSSLVVPAIFFKDLPLGRCFIWVQQECKDFCNRCQPHSDRQYGFDQLRLDYEGALDLVMLHSLTEAERTWRISIPRAAGSDSPWGRCCRSGYFDSAPSAIRRYQ